MDVFSKKFLAQIITNGQFFNGLDVLGNPTTLDGLYYVDMYWKYVDISQQVGGGFIFLGKWKKLSQQVWAHFWVGMGIGNCHAKYRGMFPKLIKSYKASKFVPKIAYF